MLVLVISAIWRGAPRWSTRVQNVMNCSGTVCGPMPTNADPCRPMWCQHWPQDEPASVLSPDAVYALRLIFRGLHSPRCMGHEDPLHNTRAFAHSVPFCLSFSLSLSLARSLFLFLSHKHYLSLSVQGARACSSNSTQGTEGSPSTLNPQPQPLNHKP